MDKHVALWCCQLCIKEKEMRYAISDIERGATQNALARLKAHSNAA